MTTAPAVEDVRHAFILGAFLALGISNVDMAGELAKLTRSVDEAIEVIQRLKAGREGDRVHPVREWLMAKRAT